MPIENNDDYIIEDYLLGRLNKSERDKLENRRIVDADFNAALSRHQDIKEGIEAYGRQTMKEELKTIHEKVVVRNSGGKKWIFWLLGVAVLFVIILFLLMSPSGQNTSERDLYATHFTPFEFSVGARSNSEDKLRLIETHYNDGAYEEVIPLITSALDDLDNERSDFLLILGIAYMETGNPTEAIRSFNRIIDSGDFNYADEARWYKVLAHLKMGDLDLVKSVIAPIRADSKANHHTEAIKLYDLITDD